MDGMDRLDLCYRMFLQSNCLLINHWHYTTLVAKGEDSGGGGVMGQKEFVQSEGLNRRQYYDAYGVAIIAAITR